MGFDEIAEGQRIVESMFRNEATNISVSMEELEWGLGRDDFDRGLHCLAYTVNGQRRVEKFSREDLSYAPGDKNVRGQLAKRVSRYSAASNQRRRSDSEMLSCLHRLTGACTRPAAP